MSVSLSTVPDPQALGYTPYHVTFTRGAYRARGQANRQPVRTHAAIVWAWHPDHIAAVLDYHYGKEWSNLQIEEDTAL